jgi:hypothetical protein
MARCAEGLRDEPHPGAPRKVTEEYGERLVQAVRRRPRSLGLPFSLWTLRRLADHMAEQTGIRELFPNVKALVAAAYDFFERHNRRPSDVLSIIGSDPAETA